MDLFIYVITIILLSTQRKESLRITNILSCNYLLQHGGEEVSDRQAVKQPEVRNRVKDDKNKGEKNKVKQPLAQVVVSREPPLQPEVEEESDHEQEDMYVVVTQPEAEDAHVNESVEPEGEDTHVDDSVGSEAENDVHESDSLEDVQENDSVEGDGVRANVSLDDEELVEELGSFSGGDEDGTSLSCGSEVADDADRPSPENSPDVSPAISDSNDSDSDSTPPPRRSSRITKPKLRFTFDTCGGEPVHR